MTLFLSLVSLARAYDSEAQPLDMATTVDLFSGVEVSTGLLPSADSPLAVEFGILTTGGATVAMQGEANVSWPEALQLSLEGTPGTGTYSLDTSIDAVTTVYVDVFGYSDAFEIDRRSLPIAGDTAFDPFRLGGRLEVVDTLDSTSLLDYAWSLGPVELRFLGSMTPVVTAGYTSLSWTTGDGATTTTDGPLAIPVERAPAADVDATLRGLWDGRLDLVLTPSMEACIDIVVYSDCFEVASFDFPIEVGGDTVEQDFPVQALSFPLPMLETDVTQGDLGDVKPGSTATLPVPLRNVGELLVEGTASIRGDGAFTVFPTGFTAAPGAEDGVLVSFAPTADGPVTAELVLASNDPSQPEIVIPLAGNGATPEEAEEDVLGDAEDAKGSVNGCGCATDGGSPEGVAVAFGALALAWARRARSPRA